MRNLLYAVLLLLVGSSVEGQENAAAIFPQALSPRIANYEIKARLLHDQRQLKGTVKLTWNNPSDDEIKELPFHLYLNAFKNNQSTFFREGGDPFGIRSDDSEENRWGWIHIDHFEDQLGNDLSAEVEYIQPDDDNEADQTVAQVRLREPIPPRGSIVVTLDFTAKIPRVLARTGYAGDYYLMAQWFPKIGVYEPAGMRYAKTGQWNCHQFHANSEFYADFGNYDVELTLPDHFIVGATGSLRDVRRDASTRTKTWIYRAEDVIDFAWTASPRFVLLSDKWEHVDIRLYIQPEHRSLADRYLQSAKESLEYFDEHLGRYPYPTLSIVDPPIEGGQSGGMEYPTFITGGSFHELPDGLRFVEIVTVHEFGHQYFMQLLATNEFEESWMDEGFNTYFEARIMDHYYGEKTSSANFFGFRYGGAEGARGGYVSMSNPKIAENFRPVWEFKHGGYSNLTYNKTATWLKTLEGLVGIETMDKIMKTYFKCWKFKHPCADDFIAIVNEVVAEDWGERYGPDMNWFFDQVLYGSDVCDYKVSSVRNVKVAPLYGVFEDRDTWTSAFRGERELAEERQRVG
ncbi:MAG: M1 family metallopeptidase, partial [Bacteroidota bacterium]